MNKKAVFLKYYIIFNITIMGKEKTSKPVDIGKIKNSNGAPKLIAKPDKKPEPPKND